MFEAIELRRWRQFDEVDITFHERLTILTGANGAGKTSILHLLNRHWGWNIPYVSSPTIRGKGIRKYWSGFWHGMSDDEPAQSVGRQQTIGSIRYKEHAPSRLSVAQDVKETFAVQIDPQPALEGVYVPSHRPLYVHQKVDSIPTGIDARRQLFDVYLSELRKRFGVNQRLQSPSFMLKQSLMSLATFGYGNEAVAPNSEARETFEGFQHVLGLVLPPSLKFRRLIVQVPDVVLHTDTGDIAFDAVSGGISSIIDMAWQIYLYSTLAPRFVVAIDEPEAHLHPELQQLILPRLVEAFPRCQFIVATHNPFVVTSTPESNVHVLRYTDRGKVVSVLLADVDKTGTANDVLRDVLGLRRTTATWVEQRVQAIVREFTKGELSDARLQSLRRQLEELGMERYVPETVAEVFRQSRRS